MHSSFLSHAGGRYFWFAVLLIIGSITLYVLDDPRQPANGGTVLGYTLGIFGALMIVWLAYLGRRKRNFAKGWGSVRGWVSAHVYFGAALLVVATLHTGFQFGMNIHTLAFVLMCAVIFSGFYGVYAYRVYPRARNDIKNSKPLDDIFLQLEEVDAQLVRLIENVGDNISTVVTSAIERTVIGGGFLDQLLGRDGSRVFISSHAEDNKGQQRALDYLVDQVSSVQGPEAATLSSIVRLFGTRKRLLGIIREDIRLHAMVGVWLVFHVPMTFALIAALLAHIFAVTIYW